MGSNRMWRFLRNHYELFSQKLGEEGVVKLPESQKPWIKTFPDEHGRVTKGEGEELEEETRWREEKRRSEDTKADMENNAK